MTFRRVRVGPNLSANNPILAAAIQAEADRITRAARQHTARPGPRPEQHAEPIRVHSERADQPVAGDVLALRTRAVVVCPCGADDGWCRPDSWCRTCREHHGGGECSIDEDGHALARCGCPWLLVELDDHLPDCRP